MQLHFANLLEDMCKISRWFCLNDLDIASLFLFLYFFFNKSLGHFLFWYFAGHALIYVGFFVTIQTERNSWVTDVTISIYIYALLCLGGMSKLHFWEDFCGFMFWILILLTRFIAANLALSGWNHAKIKGNPEQRQWPLDPKDSLHQAFHSLETSLKEWAVYQCLLSHALYTSWQIYEDESSLQPSWPTSCSLVCFFWHPYEFCWDQPFFQSSTFRTFQGTFPGIHLTGTDQ